MVNVNKRTIMIIDDVEMNIVLIKNILIKHDFNVLYSQSPVEAFEMFKIILPDLILLDIMMPELDGISVCTKIKSMHELQNIPVIFLTAIDNPAEIVKGFKSGGVDYVRKPCNVEELLARINTHLRLKEIENELKEANSAKDLLFSIIAHDLRGNVGNIANTLQVLTNEENILNLDEVKSFLIGLSAYASETSFMLEDLLNWAESQKDSVIVNPGFYDLPALSNKIIGMLSQSANKKGIKIINQNVIEQKAYFDENMIAVVLRNLISNAIKFTDTGGYIYISHYPNGKYLNVTVRDSGIGISEENINKIFRKQSIFSTRGTFGEKGTGLGLKVCQEFIERNNGCLKVESVPGQGTTFTFSLPLEEIILY